ncbi:hypothetical protein [Herbidospora sp. NBRC 101105]|uniref:hypothetical protein n=1 Tax=Herbidospora sp. NBRC 101105 TaxID=3032195 RepID=UPI002556ECA9|nr:hypothetical protein [Herbidospora sp. NBRC 101105]
MRGVAACRAMFGLLPVLAEPPRELMVADTPDGVASARARVGGRRPRRRARRVVGPS